MPVRRARRPNPRWIIAAAVLAVLLVWYAAPTSVTRSKWQQPRPPLAVIPDSEQADPRPAPSLEDAALPIAPQSPASLDAPPKDLGLTAEPVVGSNDLDFLDTHLDMLIEPAALASSTSVGSLAHSTTTAGLAAASKDSSASTAILASTVTRASTATRASATTHASASTHASALQAQASGPARITFENADDYLEHFAGLYNQSVMSVSEAKSSCSWTTVSDVNFQWGPDKDWVKADRDDAEIRQKQEEWQKFLKNDLIPYKTVADKFSGKGIVVCAGNERSLKRLRVLLKLLRFFETKLPVEIHYYGDDEVNEQKRAELKALFPNIYFNDVNGPNALLSTKHDNSWINYNVKLVSLLNSRFAEPMLLDTDNVPVSDPMSLFESDTYKTFGTVFYPDIARTRPENPMWAITNTACRPDEYEMESGQMAVNKKRFWYHLQLAAFFGHQDYYQDFLLGDKDCFRFAWHALKTPYGRPTRWITSVGYVARPKGHSPFPDGSEGADEFEQGADEFEQGSDAYQGGPDSFFCGHSFGQHHPDGVDAPILFLHGGLVKTLNQEQIEHAREHSRGFFGAYKQSGQAGTDWSQVESVGIKFDGGMSYLDQQQTGALDHIAQCTDYWSIVPRPSGDEDTRELRGFDEVFDKAGGFWMLNRTDWDNY